MSTDRWELDQDAAERLLRGERVDPGSPAGPLAHVLAAASTSGRQSELIGEDAAVAAFLAADPAPKRTRGLPLARLLTAKIAALSLATAAGGVALAAGTGALPMGPLGKGPTTTLSPVKPVTKSPSAEPYGQNETSPPRTSGAHGGPLSQLCRSYSSGNAAHRAETLRSSAYSPLVSAAGGKHRVTGYCSELLKKSQDKQKTEIPKKAKPPKQRPPQGNDKDKEKRQGDNGQGSDGNNKFSAPDKGSGGRDGNGRGDGGQGGKDRHHRPGAGTSNGQPRA
ncbi:hypothetical protein SMC26_36465 [Actinomadura fulvescens]|uniref:Uncharacterized protein n=1 Tax=Actinomadura fulvescens TaxID=46160 RepID=A0ABP6BMZ1_9ACTN